MAGIPYTEYRYISPPRTEAKMPAERLASYEARKWLAQAKFNGTNSLIFVPPDRDVFAMGRHGPEEHRAWQFTDASVSAFRSLPGDKWYVFNAELLHSKTPNIKDTNFIFDILVCEGIHLVGTTYLNRYKLLMALFETHRLWHNDYYYAASPKTWVARNITEDFTGTYRTATAKSEIEGLMLKDPNGIYRSHAASWMMRVRRSHKNYAF